MVNIKTLLPELKELVKELDEDLLARAIGKPEIDAGLREAFTQIEKGGRTAQAYEVWREDYLDQVAVAWVLACVFVRFMEDNHLIDECWLAGEGERRRMAEDTHELFFRQHPHDTDREYIQHVFHEVGKIPAAKDLFAEGKTPLWAVAPSGDAAMKLLAFWREMQPETGHLKRSFEVEGGDTRFLGDLYQELSERAKKKYALLQTPVFVEEFILDKTLDPAIDEFGLDTVRMIDPTCGSGHFLLGGFARLFRLWMNREDNEVVAAQKALDGVWGVDINPFAVAIARFRLIVAALHACGIRRISRSQAPGWELHVAAGDTLLFGSRPTYASDRAQIKHQAEMFKVPLIYAVEEPEAVNKILDQGYHVVVGNPPYITVKDKAQNEEYRGLYSTCHRQYSLGVPFTQRFWELAIRKGERISQESEAMSSGPGCVGMITANSFMKREFGKKLIEEFFPKIDLTHVIDTSGAYIPGHGTPTVILFGRSRKPVGESVRAVLGIKGEPSTPDDPSQGLVWQSIVRQIVRAGAEDEFTSTAEVPRSTFANHPWSIGGGGAAELKATIEEGADCNLSNLVDLIGYICMTRADELYVAPREALKRSGFMDDNIVYFVEGDVIRDWTLGHPSTAVFPYDKELRPVEDSPRSPVIRFLWPYRTILWLRQEIGGTQKELGMTWHEWNRFQRERFGLPYFLAFAFVATHNHFVLDRGGKVFKQSAPIIKLPADATEDDHIALLGLLNSSTACFWMKQTFHNKGSTVDQHGARQRTTPFEDFYEYTGTGLQRFPLPEKRPAPLARSLDRLGREYNASLPGAIVELDTPNLSTLDGARRTATSLRSRMIALQEELDWQCYLLYGLLSEDLRFDCDDVPELSLGQRAFEISMARQMAKGELETAWFERHGSIPIIELPGHWPEAYRKLVERRIEIMETNSEIGLIERPEYKRRWNDEPWQDQQHRALRNWLLDRLEDTRYWPDTSRHQPTLQSTAQIADKASGDHDFLQVAALYRGRTDFDVAALVNELIESESVPFLPVLRYKPSGLRKREVWERTWDLQRKQDAGENVGDIPVPPRYATADFLKNDYWRLRGKLDVPKERWISYPHLQPESDPSLVVGWAGWDHLQQASALVAYYDARKREGWEAKRLTPILAGLDQLLPWIHQWHPEIDPEFGDTAGQSYQSLLENDAHELGLTLDDIRNWEPPVKGGKRKAKG